MLFRFILLLGTLLFLSCSQPKHFSSDYYLYLKIDTSEKLEKYGYTDSTGKIIIPFDKYPMCFTDTIKTIGFVAVRHQGLSKVKGYYAINRNDQILFQVYPFDNGIDMVQEGLFRIVDEQGLIGFADMSGKIMIRPRYAYVDRFTDGLASFCVGCSPKTYVSDKEEIVRKKGDEYQWEGNEIIINRKHAYGYVNHDGDTVLQAVYDRAGPFMDGIAVVFKDGSAYCIDKKGNKVTPDIQKHPSFNPNWIRAYDRVKYIN